MGDSANPDEDTAAVLERAEAAILQGVKGRSREVLVAKIGIARQQRDAAVHGGSARISQEYAAKGGGFNSGARLAACWTLALDEVKTATGSLLGDLLAMGVAEDVTADFLVADAHHFLRATSTHLVTEQSGANPGQTLRLVSEYAALAGAHAAGIRDLVRSRRYDFEQEKGTKLERRIRWLARRPAVTIWGSVWILITAIYGHIEMFWKLWSAISKK